MTAGEIVGIIGISVTILGIITGGTWWMASLFSHVKSNGREGKRTYTTLNELKVTLVDHVSICDKERLILESQHKETHEKIANHEKRLIRYGERISKIED